SLGDHEDVGWGERMDVVERENKFILIDFAAGQLAAKDSGEDVAVIVGLSCIDRHWVTPERLRLTGLTRPLPRAAMSDETPAESLIPYDEIVQDALRAVVGRVLGEVELSGGLPGDHHFYITFKTRAPGVSI